MSFYSSEANKDGDGSAEANKDGDGSTVVVELYQKMLKSVEARTMPPNAWLWSLIGNCSSREDINLLFQILQKLRVFRLSNLRIMDNFNDHLCMKVSEACARANAIDYGMKALWKHNIYGLTPSIASAHYLLLHAKKNNDIKLMERIMQVLRRNSLPLQPGTADIVFSTCFNANNWDLLSKFSKLFLKAGVKLRLTTFDVWMEFAAKIGDAQSMWKIQKLRSKSTQKLTLASAFSCAKAYLVEHNPKSAAAIIHLLYQELPDKKKPGIKDELQKLISQWPDELMKMQKEEDREAFAEALRSDISLMVTSLMDLGMAVNVNSEELTC